MKKLESCWHGFLRRMVKGGFRNKPTEPGNDTNFSLVYTNDDILRIKSVVRYESSLTPNILNT